MAIVNQLRYRDSIKGDRAILRKRQRAIDGLLAMARATRLVVLLAPGVYGLHDEIVYGLKVTVLDFFFNQALCFGLEADRHGMT